jgi:hypothetical protein
MGPIIKLGSRQASWHGADHKTRLTPGKLAWGRSKKGRIQREGSSDATKKLAAEPQGLGASSDEVSVFRNALAIESVFARIAISNLGSIIGGRAFDKLAIVTP